MCLNNSQNVANLLLLVFSHEGIKITESFAFFPNLLQGSRVFISQRTTKIKTLLKFFTNRRLIEKLRLLYLILVAVWKIMETCTKLSHCVQIWQIWMPTRGCENLSRRLRIVTGKVYPTRTLYGTICGIRRHLEETIGSKLAV